MTQEKFEIQKADNAQPEYARQLFALFRDVFELEADAPVSELYLEKLLARPDFIVLVALHQNRVVAGLTAYELSAYHAERSELMIYDLATHPEFQRQGIAAQLIEALKKYCRDRGIEEIFVPAHEEDVHALEFYRATGGTEERVRHFTYTV